MSSTRKYQLVSSHIYGKLVGMLLLIISFFSCETDITVDLPVPESLIVVDGYVEPDQPIYVLLTRNAAYFAPINQNTIINAVEKGAIVTVNDGFITEQMIELDTTINGFSVSGFYVSLSMRGVKGRKYSLSITSAKGEVLSASTNLLYTVPLDSIWFKSLDNNDTLGFVWAHLTDPDTFDNCYRWFAKRMSKDADFIPPFGSSFEDKFINGQSFDFAYNRGSIPNSTAPDDTTEEAGLFKKGDTIIVKFSSIDRGVYEFWRDAEAQIGNNGGPFASPSNIKSNVVGGLGCFAGYSSSFDTLIAK